MMKSFLYNVAQDLLKQWGEDLHRVTVVFPNKRASLFLNRALAEISEKPIWSPQYTTISELFQKMSTLQVADRIKLICELHKTQGLGVRPCIYSSTKLRMTVSRKI